MSHKSKGINAERELIHLFWQTGDWAACRVAGSGSVRYPSADIIASNARRRLVIEVKVTKDQSKYFPQVEVDQFREFARIFGAEPWLAVKFKGFDWFFFTLDDLQMTKSNFVITSELAQLKGLSFDELLG